jgi:ubiquinone/menaquinone biosynthesis C-methylase UbiE
MKDYIKINRNAYDALHQDYEQRAIDKSQFETKANVLAGSLLRLLEQRFEQITVLEVGPGSGEVLTFFEHSGCRTIAVELSRNMAAVARRRATNSIFIVNDINEIQFASEQFEGIYAGALIHLFPLNDAIDLVRNFYAWLKPGGVLFINTTKHLHSEEGFYEKSDYKGLIKRFRRKWTEAELLHTLQNAKFEVIDQITSNEQDRQKEWIAFICQK